METKLGKISSVKFGLGGYQGAMIGLHLSFSFDECCGISDSVGAAWDPETIECDKHSEWSESDRDRALSNLMREVSKLLDQAKVTDINDLKGKPVELKLDGMKLSSWRILTEVL
jgi:hypothetical protein